MRVLLVSQCTKNARKETIRIIDQFAERTGDLVWQTHITKLGLDTLRKLLKSTARKNTAVACHLLKNRQQTELLWVVGNTSQFNCEGAVPTNTTRRDILRSSDENDWLTGESMAIMVGIAGLFHDFGKANNLFQKKLKGERQEKGEPLRHEWLSLHLFLKFVEDQSDKNWLEKLATITPDIDFKIELDLELVKVNPFYKSQYSPFTKFIGWLIVSHHLLPRCNSDEKAPRLAYIGKWMESKQFHSRWNSPQIDRAVEEDFKRLLDFNNGLPFRSKIWCKHANCLGRKALNHLQYLENNWFEDRFSMHLSRLALMLADHCYSSESVNLKLQDIGYKCYANTDNWTKDLKQKLDEHNVGVSKFATSFIEILPSMSQSLPSISRHKGFKKRTTNQRFSWQNKAFDLATGLREKSLSHGFFGINMASTGCGKTFANVRIMYGLSDEQLGCRLSIALGLRVLTLQTGDALKEKLSLNQDDLSILIGSSSIKTLYEMNKERETGSESIEDLFDNQYVKYDGCLDDGMLGKWLKRSRNKNLHKLVSAPIVVSTIDHLIPATEGLRGGKQIAPILRLLTSDLILDEPDDFNIEDLPALCRLVNFAGVFGSRVLLSSATLPPSIIQALFQAYASGRKAFNKSRRPNNYTNEVPCAWFDEFGSAHSFHQDSDSFLEGHTKFIENRVKNLSKTKSVRRGELIPILTHSSSKPDVIKSVGDAIYDGIHDLHTKHYTTDLKTGKSVSFGLVRMANINPMVATAKDFINRSPKKGVRIHFCVYHSQYPLMMRSEIERVLDQVLDRRNPNIIWEIPEVRKALNYPEENHIFVVFATAVAEVGRDHDYDWSIAEPSSMRSLIQVAGRVQRHRQQAPEFPNIKILEKNINALQNKKVAYFRPGFEKEEQFVLLEKSLLHALSPKEYQDISALPRIKVRDELESNKRLVDLEHAHMQAQLFGDQNIRESANLWWENSPDWCGEMQRRTPFRKSQPQKDYIFFLEDELSESVFCSIDYDKEPKSQESEFMRVNLEYQERVAPWINFDSDQLIKTLAHEQNLTLSEASKRFSSFSLRKLEDTQVWCYHASLGIYQEI